MKSVCIIPARMESSRFPGKPMEKIRGMPMIGHCVHRAQLAFGKESVFVATCNDIIDAYVRGIGGNAIMTSTTHERASTRTAEAIEIIEKRQDSIIDTVLMMQGDEPLISPADLKSVLLGFVDDSVTIINLMSKIRSKKQLLDRNNVKVVFRSDMNALYFSREPIPSPWQGWGGHDYFLQTGIIGFRREALVCFNKMQETNLERVESVDMNRVLEWGGAIRMLSTDEFTLGVDNPEDLTQAERLLATDLTVEDYIQT